MGYLKGCESSRNLRKEIKEDVKREKKKKKEVSMRKIFHAKFREKSRSAINKILVGVRIRGSRRDYFSLLRDLLLSNRPL